ncbi:MAG: 30S ribosomal protein S17e [Candidatus Bathyarchaeota archaeon]|nr:30S ribosomal protein S17e [Candidatus Bathyarchaeota archaeon]
MGKVKTEQIKRIANELLSRFPNKFSNNFEENKRAVDALTHGATTRVRNQIAGYITHTLSLEAAEASNESTEEAEMQA